MARFRGRKAKELDTQRYGLGEGTAFVFGAQAEPGHLFQILLFLLTNRPSTVKFPTLTAQPFLDPEGEKGRTALLVRPYLLGLKRLETKG